MSAKSHTQLGHETLAYPPQEDPVALEGGVSAHGEDTLAWDDQRGPGTARGRRLPPRLPPLGAPQEPRPPPLSTGGTSRASTANCRVATYRGPRHGDTRLAPERLRRPR